MPIPRPKMLARFTVPTGGWTLRIQVSVLSQFDTQIEGTVAAGDYYLAWDAQSDDFLQVLGEAINDDLVSNGLGRGFALWIDSDHKVNIGFDGSDFKGPPAGKQDVRIDWTAQNGSDIGGVLGFDTSANLELTGSDNPTTTASYQHAYGWYASSDMNIEEDFPEFIVAPQVQMDVSVDGSSVTHLYGEHKEGRIAISHLPKARTWSRAKTYTQASVWPYARNVPLECWFRAVMDGAPFRYYRHSRQDVALAGQRGTATGGSQTTLTDTSVSFPTDPDKFVGWALLIGVSSSFYSDITAPQRAYVSSHTSTVLTIPNSPQDQQVNLNANASDYYLHDLRYKTLKLDLRSRGLKFSPRELPAIAEFNYSFPVIEAV